MRETQTPLHSATKITVGLLGLSRGKFAGDPHGFVLLRMLEMQH